MSSGRAMRIRMRCARWSCAPRRRILRRTLQTRGRFSRLGSRRGAAQQRRAVSRAARLSGGHTRRIDGNGRALGRDRRRESEQADEVRSRRREILMPIDATLRASLFDGLVIPAHPLALDADRRLDERRQRALSRYYLDDGAGGLAVAVHTTQFAIHEPHRGLLRPVLELAAETARAHEAGGGLAPVLVAGVTGPTGDAVAEAQL